MDDPRFDKDLIKRINDTVNPSETPIDAPFAMRPNSPTIDKITNLRKAVNKILILRLHGQLNTVEGMTAWNELLEAHDNLNEIIRKE